MIAVVTSGTTVGIDGFGVSVEVDLARGLPSFTIVGLPNAAVRQTPLSGMTKGGSQLLRMPYNLSFSSRRLFYMFSI